MEVQLQPDWFAQGLVDFEYKKYRLMAYLQVVKQNFNRTHLYPYFSDLVFHYENLISFRENKDKLNKQFPKHLSKLDFQNLKMEFSPEINEAEELLEIQEIVDFSIPQFKYYLKEGKEIYDFIEEKIEIDRIGLLPLYKDEGYLLLSMGPQSPVNAYEYRITIFENADQKYRGIHSNYVCSFDWGICNTFESMKLALIKNNPELPNPATYVIHSGMSFPENEAMMPIAKRKFVRLLSAESSK